MVGRAELITPSVERELKKQILTYRDGNDTAKSRAVAAVHALRLGRFQYAAFDRVNAGEKDQAFFSAAQELSAASAREDERSARN